MRIEAKENRRFLRQAWLLPVLFAAALMAAPVCAGMDEAYNAFKRGDFETAIDIWEPRAEEGDSWAQFNMGILYEKGLGVSRDDLKAFDYFQKAAGSDQILTHKEDKKIGYRDAYFRLGLFYFQGRGVEKDYYEAYRAWSAAGWRGHPVALFNLGIFFEKGYIPQVKSLSEAWKYYHLAAEQGHSDGAENRDRVAEQMSEEEVEHARRWAEMERKNMRLAPVVLQ